MLNFSDVVNVKLAAIGRQDLKTDDNFLNYMIGVERMLLSMNEDLIGLAVINFIHFWRIESEDG